MTHSSRPASGAADGKVYCHTALVTRIALFLKLLSKENFQALMTATAGRTFSTEGELLTLMVKNKCISPKLAPELKQACLSFARAQKDSRFGSLCIEFGFLTRSNLDLALEEQKKLGDAGRSVFLGDLLVEAGMLSLQQQKLILQKQKLDLQEVPPDDDTRIIREDGITLMVHDNGLRVTGKKARAAGAFRIQDASELREFLEDHGIIYGISDNKTLDRFLTSDTGRVPDMAKGLAPIPGTDAEVFYLFDREYLSAGRLGRNGTMDYKSRGQIPFVSKGDLLAEKMPSKPGRDGISVFGDVIEAEPPMEVDIICGKGVTCSEDGLRAFAGTDGYPKLDQNGTLSVDDAHLIRGDVDYTTGHVKFASNVFITGSIKAGFKVEARDVVVMSVDGGIIHATGDVSVANGVTSSRIIADGCVNAGFVHKSTIGCLGDVDIAKEVVDSQIFLEGTFDMSQGKIYATTVAARGGAKIYHVGAVKAVPSLVEVGTSPHLQQRLHSIDLKIEDCKLSIKALGRKIEEAEAKNPKLLERLKQKETEHNQKISALQEEKDALEQKIRVTPPRPILDVRGKILTGTIVKGPHASLTISKELARVRIMEMSAVSQNSAGKGKKLWEMIVGRL